LINKGEEIVTAKKKMELSYTFRKSAFDKPCQYTLVEEGLLCINLHNGMENTLRYKTITSITLQFQPYNRYRHNNYRCRITSAYGYIDILSSSYLEFAKFSDQAEEYNPFVKTLVKRVKAVNPSCQICTGQVFQAFYGNLMLIFASLAVLLWVSFFLPLAGRLMAIIFLLIGAWQYTKMSVTINKPRIVESNEIPDYVLPKYENIEQNESQNSISKP
jgi:hypothetical protein